MTLPPLTGHREIRKLLSQAVGSARLPQLLLLTGPSGVGKQRVALWLGQLLLCERPAAEPCGTCRACRQVTGLSHPDLHWFMPVPRPKATDPDRQTEELAQSIGDVIAERRNKPLYGPLDGMAAHFVATARLIQREAALTPVEGSRKVFVVGRAERLVPQEANPEAANVLLKLLEEPPSDSYFVLTATDVSAVLPTVVSRAVPMRLNRLGDDEVEEFLRTQLPELAPADARARVARARGSIGAALAEDRAGTKAQEAANELLLALLGGPGPRMERVLQQSTWSARGDFSAMLDALSETLGEAARGSTGLPLRRPVPKALLTGRSLEALVQASELVSAAREVAQGNVNPQLLLATLSEELAEIL